MNERRTRQLVIELSERLGDGQLRWAIPVVGLVPNVEADLHRFEPAGLFAGTAAELHYFTKSRRSRVHESIALHSVESFEKISVGFKDGDQGATELLRRDGWSWCVVHGSEERGEMLARMLTEAGVRPRLLS